MIGSTNKTEKKVKDISSTLIEYENNIVYLRLKDGVEFDIPAIQEQFDAQRELVQNDKYAVLVDATHNIIISKEGREYMANNNPPNRLGTALLTNKNLAMLIIANFYINFNKPIIPTRLFKDENEAVKWLKNLLPKSL